MEETATTGWIEIASAALLATAALATAWAGYQGSLWDGEQAASYSRAGALRIDASTSIEAAHLRESINVNLFNAWLNAKASGQDQLAAFYAARFPPGFGPSFEAWLATHPLQNPQAPATPFAMPGYHPRGEAEGQALKARAEATFERGQYDNQISDSYGQATAILAMALFFGGIGQVFRRRRVRLALISIAAVATVLGIIRIITLPAISLL